MKPLPTKLRKRVYATKRIDRDRKSVNPKSRVVNRTTKNKLYWQPAKKVRTDFGTKIIWKATLSHGEYYRIVRSSPKSVYREINPPKFTVVKAVLSDYTFPIVGSYRVKHAPKPVEQILKTFTDLDFAMQFVLDHSGYEESNNDDVLLEATRNHVDELPPAPVTSPTPALESTSEVETGKATQKKGEPSNEKISGTRSKEKDRFGYRLGTRAARLNAVITTEPQTIKEIQDKADYHKNISGHMFALIKRGFVKRTPDKKKYYSILENKPKAGERLKGSKKSPDNVTTKAIRPKTKKRRKPNEGQKVRSNRHVSRSRV
jgi:hypothetical protein